MDNFKVLFPFDIQFLAKFVNILRCGLDKFIEDKFIMSY